MVVSDDAWVEYLSGRQTFVVEEIAYRCVNNEGESGKVFTIDNPRVLGTAFPALVIRTGATSKVVGREWMGKWIQSAKNPQQIKTTPVERSFEFGDSRVFKSEGAVILEGYSTAMTQEGWKLSVAYD